MADADITTYKESYPTNQQESKEIIQEKIKDSINKDDSNGFYKLNWLQRIGYGAGDLANNFAFAAIGSYILFFYTDVFQLGGKPENSASLAGTMMLIVCFIEIICDPIVGTFVDKKNPRWGKYRSYLIFGGIPLSLIMVLCFWDQFKPSVVYAYITYIAFQISYTVVSVPYGALNASLTRDSNEITILTSTRMVMANLGGLAVNGGLPIVVALFSKKDLPIQYALFQALGSLPSFIFLPLIPMIKNKIGKKSMFYVFITIAILGYIAIYIVSVLGVNDHIVWLYIAQFIKSSGLTVATGYMWVLVPEVISYGEYTTNRRISGIVNALTAVFLKAGMALGGAVPGWVLAWTHYKAAETASTLPKDSRAWFYTIAVYAFASLILYIFCFTQTKERVVMKENETQNVKISDLWKEFLRNRPLRVLSYFFIIAFIAMFSSNSTTAYLMDDLHLQVKSAQEGVRWCVTVIPSILFFINMIIISRYELTDEKIEQINKEIEERQKV